MKKEWTNEKVIREIEKSGGIYKGSSSDWREDFKEAIKEQENFHQDLKEIEEDVKELKKTKVLGFWKDYKVFWISKYYTRNIEDVSEVLRVKFYRAKEIYSKIMNNLDYKECDNCIYSFIDGYCLGVRADSDTKDILYWLLLKNFFSEL